MDVKSAFLNGEFQEEVNIEQPEDFLLSDNRNDVCKLNKVLYGLKQLQRHGTLGWKNIFRNRDSKEKQLIVTCT